MPVRVVGLPAPERDPTPREPRVVGTLGERGVDRARETKHLPVRVADFGVLDQEAPPEATAEQARQPLAVGKAADLVPGRLERARGLRRQRPLPHLPVRGGRQIDTPARRKALDDVRERRQLEPARGEKAVEEAVEPSSGVDVGVGARPGPELLAVVDHGECRHAAPPSVQVLERLIHVGERDQVAQRLADRENSEAGALLVRQVVPAQGIGVQPGEGEVAVVDEHVLDPGLAQHARKVRLPDPLGEPHPAGAHAEVRLEERRQPLDLADLVMVGQHGEDRLVESAGQELDLAASGDGAEQVEGARRRFAQPLQKAARTVNAQPHFGTRVKPFEEWSVGALRRLDEDVVEVADRLMVVNTEAERQPVHFPRADPHSRWRSRCTTVAA